jgi:pimeloyl-ACP methyl ester carboxylesterase
MEKIFSKDGTPIACWESGEGPPLVLVHGSNSDHTYWQPALPALEESFRVYTIDRRGRGESGDSDDYAIEREFEDVAAVVDSIGEPANLLGHSYEAICTLAAATLTSHVDKLVLYEPPINLAGGEMFPPGFVERLEALLEEGDRDGAIETFIREAVGLPPEEVEYLRSLPSWQVMVASAHTLPRELKVVNEKYRFEVARFRDLRTTTLLLGGGDSAPFMQESNQAVAEALPDSRIAVMSGVGHDAVETGPDGPDLLVREVLRFLT